MADTKVTVLMSVYNGEKYLLEAIDSILNQTFMDFEFLIIDDGSTDGSADIIQSYSDPRIRFVQNEKNIGLTRSLNKGLELAKGEYIARQDADDISLPDRLEKQVKFLMDHKDVGFLGSSWYVIDADGRRMGVSKAFNGKYAAHFMCHGTTLTRKDCLKAVGGYREIFEYAEDYDLWLRIAEKFGVANLSDPFYEFRVHPNSISSTNRLAEDLMASLAIEMAQERKKYGKDRLSTANQEEAIRIRNQRLRVSGIKKRKVLSHTYSTWSQAAFALGEYGRSRGYASRALRQYAMNYPAWIILTKIMVKKFKNNPVNFIIGVAKFLIRMGDKSRKIIIRKVCSG